MAWSRPKQTNKQACKVTCNSTALLTMPITASAPTAITKLLPRRAESGATVNVTLSGTMGAKDKVFFGQHGTCMLQPAAVYAPLGGLNPGECAGLVCLLQAAKAIVLQLM